MAFRFNQGDMAKALQVTGSDYQLPNQSPLYSNPWRDPVNIGNRTYDDGPVSKDMYDVMNGDEPIIDVDSPTRYNSGFQLIDAQADDDRYSATATIPKPTITIESNEPNWFNEPAPAKAATATEPDTEPSKEPSKSKMSSLLDSLSSTRRPSAPTPAPQLTPLAAPAPGVSFTKPYSWHSGSAPSTSVSQAPVFNQGIRLPTPAPAIKDNSTAVDAQALASIASSLFSGGDAKETDETTPDPASPTPAPTATVQQPAKKKEEKPAFDIMGLVKMLFL